MGYMLVVFDFASALQEWRAASAPIVLPTPGEGVIHLLFRCLRDMLLCTELLVPSMFRFSADIGHAGFLVFKDVEPFAVHCGMLEFVARKCCVELLLFCRLRSVRTEAGLREQRWGVVCLQAGASPKENDAAGGHEEN